MRKVIALALLLIVAPAFADIDTVNEKLALTGAWGIPSHWKAPVSSDGIGQDDQQQATGGYPGITWQPPPAGDSGINTTSSGALHFPLLFGTVMRMFWVQAILALLTARLVLWVYMAWANGLHEMRRRRWEMEKDRRNADEAYQRQLLS